MVEENDGGDFLREQSDDRINQILKVTLDRAPIGIAIVCGADFRFMWVNRTFAGFLNRSPKDLIGRTLLEMFPSIKERGGVERIQAARSSGQTIQARELYYPWGGKGSWWDIDHVPLGDYESCEDAVLIMVHDVTGQAQARQQLEIQNARLQAVLGSLPVGVWITDATGRVLEKNARADEIWAGEAPMSDSIEGYEEYKTWHHDTGKTVKPEEQPLARALQGERVLAVEYDIERFDGAPGSILASAAPIRDPDGRVVGAVGLAQDVTELTRAERALETSEARLRVALANTPVSIFTVDRELRYSWVQDTIFGYPEEELVGKRDDQVLAPQNAAELMAEKRGVLKSGEGVHREISMWIDGELQTYNLTLEPVYGDYGEVEGLTGAMMDVTRTRRLEAEYYHHLAQVEMQRRLVERLEEERTRIARDLHDGPLQDLIAASYNLAVAEGVADEEARRRELQEVRESLRRQIIDLRLFLNELRPPTLAPFGLEPAIRAHAETFSRRNPGLDVQLDLKPDRQSIPEKDRMVLFRIYQELLFNVRRHSGASRVVIRLRLQPGEIVLEVQDNGTGFTPPDSWVDLARQGHLGLVGVRERAETVGGRVEVESSVEAGTRVRVVVPVDEVR